MEPDDDIPEATVRLTRRVRRRSEAVGTDPQVDAESEGDAEAIEDRTVVMSRRRRGADAADAEPEEASLEDRTVVMSRRRRGADAVEAEPEEDSPLVEDRTVVMSRRRSDADAVVTVAEAEADDELDEHTHMIEDRTVAVKRSRRPRADVRPVPEEDPGLDDRTVAVERRRPEAPADRSAEDEDLYETVRRAPASDTAPPPAIYKPRAAPRTPHRPPAQPEAIAPTRVIDPGIASVAKASRRQSALAVAAVGGACVVSVVGLALLGVMLFA
ncbi:hypothetical protein [Microbacterium hydrocarbonoxydans]|uniref:hypothetical protein n=1 Tax=Microbacterium hydrocarbonoxydans TaxID=273678 RepID=UPI0005EBFB0B|nr:hypothetical protein [Microbacterium hydrocarbonoxydans]